MFLPSATKLRRLCFYRRLSVHGGEWGCLPQCMLGYHTPQEQTPNPPGADTPLRSRHTPWSRHPPEQTPPQEQTPPRSRHPLGEDTPRADTPPGADTPDTPAPLGADTPSPSRHPLGSRPPGSRPPPREQTPRPEIRPLLRTVRILLECILVC